MKKILFVALITVLLIIMAGVGTLIFAQEQKPEQPSYSAVVMMGGLKLKEGADQVAVEKLFNDYLIPVANDMKGVKIKVLKKMPMPNEKPDENSVDYVMMAEVDDALTLMQLMDSQNRDPRLEKFGDMMKQYARNPTMKGYTIIAKTDDSKSDNVKSGEEK